MSALPQQTSGTYRISGAFKSSHMRTTNTLNFRYEFALKRMRSCFGPSLLTITGG